MKLLYVYGIIKDMKENTKLRIIEFHKLTFWRLALVSWSSLDLGPFDAIISYTTLVIMEDLHIM